MTAEQCALDIQSDASYEELIDPIKFASIVAIKFARHHVRETLLQALEDSPTGSSTDIPSYEDMKDAILNAYPLEKIK